MVFGQQPSLGGGRIRKETHIRTPKAMTGGGHKWIQTHEKMERVNSQRYSRRGFVSRLAGCLQPFLFPDTLNAPKGPGNAILRTTNPPPKPPTPLKLGYSSQCTNHRSYITLHFTERLRGTQEQCGGHGACVWPPGVTPVTQSLFYSLPTD